MNTIPKLIRIIIKSQILSIIFIIIGRIHINLLLLYNNLFANSIILVLSCICFTIFCIILSLLFLNENFINLILVSLSYIFYWFAFGSKIFLFNSHTNPNDFGFGILGLSTEIIISLFQYIIVIIASIIAISIHINSILKKRN